MYHDEKGVEGQRAFQEEAVSIFDDDEPTLNWVDNLLDVDPLDRFCYYLSETEYGHRKCSRKERKKGRRRRKKRKKKKEEEL